MNYGEHLFVKLKKELVLQHPKTVELPIVNDDTRRLELIKKIELVISKVLRNIANHQSPILKTILHCQWDNCFFDNRLRIKVKSKPRTIDFGKKYSRSKFASIVFLLSKIHKLLITKKKSNRRELYYKNLEIFESQRQVDVGMIDVCHLLNAHSWELRVLSTSKGIVAGPLVLKLEDGDYVDCSKKGGASVPANVLEVENMSSSATWVLIIEKDTSFQRLIDIEARSRLNHCIFITVTPVFLKCHYTDPSPLREIFFFSYKFAFKGKGYPDVNTRMLVCKFWEHLQIPILALVDADPHGFEIMCIYRFGSLSMSSSSGYLACPAVRWLGVHPSDIKPLLLDSKILSLSDVRKIHLLLERCYVEENEKLKNQLKILLEGNVKAEIEGVAKISTTYLTDTYLRNKIQCNEYF